MPSLSSNVSTGDTAEYQAVPYLLGIAHPTGFPLYTLTGWLISHVLVAGTVAWRLNFFAAVCSALTVGGVALLASALGSTAPGACLAALIFAVGPPFWRGAVHASPHTMSGMLIVFVFAASVAFARFDERRYVYVACACAGLGLATQPETLWVLPAIAVAAFARRRTLQRSTVAIGVLLVALPLLSYAYLPIRSTIVAARHLDPTAGAPLFSAGSIDWDTNQPRTLDGFFDEVLGRHEGAGNAVRHSFDPGIFASALTLGFDRDRGEYTLLVLVLAALGVVALAPCNPLGLTIVVCGTAGGILFAYTYRLDNELERYFVVTYAVTAAFVAMSTRLTLPRLAPQRVSAAATLAIAAAFAFVAWNDRSLVTELRGAPVQPVIAAVIHDTPDGAIVVVPWFEATTLAYAAFIDRSLGSRTIVAAQPDDYADRYATWAHTRRVVLFVDFLSRPGVGAIPAELVRERPSSLPLHDVYDVLPHAAMER